MQRAAQRHTEECGKVMGNHQDVNEAAQPVSALSPLLRNAVCHTGAGHAARPSCIVLGWHMEPCNAAASISISPLSYDLSRR